MKLSDLSIDQLKAKKTSMETAMAERQKASRHSKFNDPKTKMQFPPHGDGFMKLYNDVCTELKNRG